MSTGQGLQVVAGSPFTDTLDDPGHIERIGARVEVPVTRAIVAAWQTAELVNGVWVVTLDAPLNVGFFNLVWMTPEDPPSYEVFKPLQAVATLAVASWPWVAENTDAITPSPDDVARLMATRTVDDGGIESGKFDENSRPTKDQAAQLIDEAVADVIAQLRDRFDPRHYAQVKRVVSFYSAMLIEKSYYPESRDPEGGSLPWQPEYREALAAISGRIETENLAGQEPVGAILS